MKHLFILLFLMQSLLACKKNNPITADEKKPYGKLSELNYRFNDNPSETCKMIYDNSGRLSVYTDSDHKYSFLYETASSLVITRSKLSNGEVDQVVDCILNAAGAIIKMEYKEKGSVIHTYQFTYDASGALEKVKGVGSGNANVYEIDFIYTNGVMTSSKYYSNNTLTKTIQYKYDLSKPNKTSIAPWYIWPTDMLHGKPLTYHISEIKEFDAGGVLTNHRKCIVDYNADGYPVSEIIQSITTNSKMVYGFKF